MEKIIEDRYPDLDAEDQEAIRQRAVAAINMVQQGKLSVNESSEGSEPSEDAQILHSLMEYAVTLWTSRVWTS